LLTHKIDLDQYAQQKRAFDDTNAKAYKDVGVKAVKPKQAEPVQPRAPPPYKAAYISDAITTLEAICKFSIVLPRRLHGDAVVDPIMTAIHTSMVVYLGKIYSIFVTNFEQVCKHFANAFEMDALEKLVLTRGDALPSGLLRDQLLAKCGVLAARELYIAWNTFKKYLQPLKKLCQSASELATTDELKSLAGTVELAEKFVLIISRVDFLIEGHLSRILSQ
jgi:hypothetical protein